MVGACKVGQKMVVDFTDFGWCKREMLKLVNNCTSIPSSSSRRHIRRHLLVRPLLIYATGDTKKPKDTEYWKQGGMMYEDCIEWVIAAGPLV